MSEEFLYYVWQHRLFNTTDIRSIKGEKVTVTQPGYINTNAGPDFLEARIKIGETIWAGNVEIHLKTSDWTSHGHQTDKAFDNVILHVVYDHDYIPQNMQTNVPVLALSDKINPTLFTTYKRLLLSPSWIPCESLIGGLDPTFVKQGLHRLLIERLERKSEHICEVLKETKNNWEETCYRLVARQFGMKVNGDAFELLTKSLPQSILGKYRNESIQIEALIFGQAGLLNESFKDDYPKQLQHEYQILKQKHSLEPMNAHLWKFLRLRPSNFPTIRLAQFAQLIIQSTHLFSKLLSSDSPKNLSALFSVGTATYWEYHYRFDHPSGKKVKRLGKLTIYNIMINAVAPLFFVYGKQKNKDEWTDKALNLLEQIPAEKNGIITKWKALGVTASNAYESQALLTLKNKYCNKKQCLKCHIGNRLIRSSKSKVSP